MVVLRVCGTRDDSKSVNARSLPPRLPPPPPFFFLLLVFHFGASHASLAGGLEFVGMLATCTAHASVDMLDGVLYFWFNLAEFAAEVSFGSDRDGRRIGGTAVGGWACPWGRVGWWGGCSV